MTPEILKVARVIHEARIALAWGKDAVGRREPWPNFDDPKVLRSYPHDPIAYVDLAVASAKAAIREAERLALERAADWHDHQAAMWDTGRQADWHSNAAKAIRALSPPAEKTEKEGT